MNREPLAVSRPAKQLALPLPKESAAERQAAISDKLRNYGFRQQAREEKRRKRNEGRRAQAQGFYKERQWLRKRSS